MFSASCCHREPRMNFARVPSNNRVRGFNHLLPDITASNEFYFQSDTEIKFEVTESSGRAIWTHQCVYFAELILQLLRKKIAVPCQTILYTLQSHV